MRVISHFIDGRSDTCAGGVTTPVYDPNTGEVQARVGHGNEAILAQAVAVARAAQPAWDAINAQRRAWTMFKYTASSIACRSIPIVECQSSPDISMRAQSQLLNEEPRVTVRSLR